MCKRLGFVMNDTDLDSVNIHDLYLKNKPTCDTIFT